ncbi:Aste57867_19816 [Aphanomyces stellatus]|uniref:Aste57867_19816 protein n=1 Tax=Aphanomyces stellatus TaxID=120398 RepID=A0A485LDC7_9STRA|nr:hypothetical protein As57867_019751 [Aphanomyces stellatus]VFT96514.1 Aste57867_19816 [Aphanomyces stellatus]
MPSNNSVGQAIVYLRPLRHMLDVETSVPVLNDAGESLGTLVVQLRPSVKGAAIAPSASGVVAGNNAKKVPGDVDDLSDDDVDELKTLDGSFLWISVQVHIDTAASKNPLLRRAAPSSYAITYMFFQSNTQSFPIDHSNTIKVLVTSKLVDYVSSETLTFEIISTAAEEKSRDAPAVAASSSTADTAAALAMQNALLEEIQRDKAKMLEDHELEKARNEALRGELGKLISHVKEQEDAMLSQVKSSQQDQSEVARLQEKSRADAREKEQLLKQLNDSDAKYQTLLTNPDTPKSSTCIIN